MQKPDSGGTEHARERLWLGFLQPRTPNLGSQGSVCNHILGAGTDDRESAFICSAKGAKSAEPLITKHQQFAEPLIPTAEPGGPEGAKERRVARRDRADALNGSENLNLAMLLLPAVPVSSPLPGFHSA